MAFDQVLLNWYRKNKRDLPWRGTRDPYKIWLSEIMLQQTRVEQGLPYYEAFIREFPQVTDLAAATEDKVMKLWQGLGYYSRARNLHFTAKYVTNELNGRFPDNYKDLLALKGVGDYTAAAIASICYNEAQPVVDGNVFRVLARYFGIATPTDTTTGRNEFRELAARVMNHKHIADYNQAIMEFGAMQCVPKNPDCARCPLVQTCEALAQGRVAEWPVKAGKTKVTDRYFHYLVLHYKDAVYLHHRSAKGIWQQLFDFPLCEVKDGNAAWTSHPVYRQLLGSKTIKPLAGSGLYKHILSHQRLFIMFHTYELKKPLTRQQQGKLVRVPLNELKNYAVPVVVARYLDTDFPF